MTDVKEEKGVMLGYIWSIRRCDDGKMYTVTNEGKLIPMEMVTLGAMWDKDPHDFPNMINFVKPAIVRDFGEYQASLEEWEEPSSAYAIEVCRVLDKVPLAERYKPCMWQSVNAQGQFFNGMTVDFEERVTQQCTDEHAVRKQRQAFYLGELFPFWMGHFPGGLHYDNTRTLQEITTELGQLTQELMDYALKHSLGPGGGLKMGMKAGGDMSARTILHKARTGSGLRKLRNSWKIACGYARMPSRDELWRKLPQVLGPEYVKEWLEFGEAVDLYLDVDKEKAC